MTQAIVQKFRDWTIRRKILTGFAAVLSLTGVQGWLAIRQLGRMSGVARRRRPARSVALAA